MVTALVAVAVVAAERAAPLAEAAPRNPGLEELWEQFPLDAQREPPAAREESPTAREETPQAPRGRPAAEPQTGGSDTEWGTFALLAVIAAGIAFLVAIAGVAVIYAGHMPRRPSVRLPARRAPRPAAVLATDRLLPARRVVDDLLGVATAALPRRKSEEAKVLTTGDQSRHASEIDDAVKAKPQVTREEKHLREPPRADAELLKRKPAANETDALKAKGGREGAVEKERLAGTETDALKEKLAGKQEQTQVAKLREHPARARPRTDDMRRRPPLRPVPDREFVAVSPDTRAAARSREAETRWWRGYVKSQFLAVVTEAGGTEAVVASSPYFRWRKGAPPPECPAAVSALEALAIRLQHQGWTVSGHGEDWFALRFRTKLDADRTGAAEVHDPGTSSGGGAQWHSGQTTHA